MGIKVDLSILLFGWLEIGLFDVCSQVYKSVFHALDTIVEVLSLFLGELVDLVEEDGQFIDALRDFFIKDL